MSKEYLKWGTEQYSQLSTVTPRLWNSIMAHRYLLPSRLQADYINQEACDYLFMDFIISYSLRMLPPEDDVIHVHYMSAIRALEFERPTYYVERGLAEALLRTDVPMDLEVSDIHWIYPQLRFYLPNNLIAITRNGQLNPAMFIDVCRAGKNDIYSLPKVYQQELLRIGANNFPEHEIPIEAFIMTTSLHFDCSEGNINYAVTAPWDTTMRNMITIGNTHYLQGSMTNDELDHGFTSRLLCFAINVLLMLSALPPEAQTSLRQPATVIRKPKQEGKRSIVGLYAAKVIGWEQAPQRPRGDLPPTPTGRHLAAHWRRGHWKRQAYGPKSGLRRHQWIAPYHVGEQ